MNARVEILTAIRERRVRTAPSPDIFSPPVVPDPVAAFVERARLANADVQFVDNYQTVPHVVAGLLRSRNLAARPCVAGNARNLPWGNAAGLTIETAAPGQDDSAIGIANFGIAETGTLAYAAAADAPPSWHFRAGFEVALIRVRDILPSMEDVLREIRGSGPLPSTLNFVTGPSRTGDIEQTLELGAHGPKALAILIVKD